MKRTTFLILSSLLILGACTSEKAEEKRQSTGSLTRQLDMVDKEGRRFGTVELDPVGGGKVYDIDGRIIGRITSPDR